MDGWSAEDVFIPSTDNLEGERWFRCSSVDHTGQTCHQPGQLRSFAAPFVTGTFLLLIRFSAPRVSTGRRKDEQPSIEDQVENSKNERSQR